MSETGQMQRELENVISILNSVASGFHAPEQTELSTAMASDAGSCVSRLEAVLAELTRLQQANAALVEAGNAVLPYLGSFGAVTSDLVHRSPAESFRQMAENEERKEQAIARFKSALAQQ